MRDTAVPTGLDPYPDNKQDCVLGYPQPLLSELANCRLAGSDFIAEEAAQSNF
jgi:hypothetical protein